jgi:hypothetical protein
VSTGVALDGAFRALDGPVSRTVRAFSAGRVRDDVLPFPARRLLASAGVLFADTTDGLYRRDADGWRLAAPRRPALPPGAAHVTALAFLGSDLVAGLFDGGLVTAQTVDGGLRWRDVPGTAAWGVNALLPAGGALYVASLRGAARFDGARLLPLEGPGAAFSLAATADGVAIGYGQGVLLPGTRLLSAFHGLPGNQAVALLDGDVLFVGTPSGLGAIEDRRVRFRVAGGEGRLPHPWVTALALSRGSLYVGTYGGGIVRRTASGVDAPIARVDRARYEPFVETEGLKINAGCLVEAGGRLYAGTDGKGLYRLSATAAHSSRCGHPSRRGASPRSFPRRARCTWERMKALRGCRWTAPLDRKRNDRRKDHETDLCHRRHDRPGTARRPRDPGAGRTTRSDKHWAPGSRGDFPARDGHRRGDRPRVRAGERPPGLREPHRRRAGGQLPLRAPARRRRWETSRSGTAWCGSPA